MHIIHINEHAEQETLLIQLWAVLVIALGRFVPALGRFRHRCGPFWTCQKFVGRFGFGPFWYRPKVFTCSIASSCSAALAMFFQL